MENHRSGSSHNMLSLYHPPSLPAFTDHRMIMSAMIAGIIAESHTEYVNVEKINKSYPYFLSFINLKSFLIGNPRSIQW